MIEESDRADPCRSERQSDMATNAAGTDDDNRGAFESLDTDAAEVFETEVARVALVSQSG